jgi:hypothetical protein
MGKQFILNMVGTAFLFLSISTVKAQDMQLPYKEIPSSPEDYSPGNLLSRMIDGLGYRFYWATEGLTEKDLAYKPSENGRSILETMEHIHTMSNNIVLAPDAKPFVIGTETSTYSFEELRKRTLENLLAASEKVRGATAEEIETYKVIFQRGDQKSEFAFWNLLNGQLSDCLYHTGQIVLMRRASGNPQNPNVNPFLGKTKE